MGRQQVPGQASGGWVEAAPFRAWVWYLMSGGRVGTADIAALAGISPCVLDHLLHGRRGRPMRRISPATASALLLVTAPQVADLVHGRAPASLLRRQLVRLRRAGCSESAIQRAAQLGPEELASLARSEAACPLLVLVRLSALVRTHDPDETLDGTRSIDVTTPEPAEPLRLVDAA
jgi:hypothetical protein